MSRCILKVFLPEVCILWSVKPLVPGYWLVLAFSCYFRLPCLQYHHCTLPCWWWILQTRDKTCLISQYYYLEFHYIIWQRIDFTQLVAVESKVVRHLQLWISKESSTSNQYEQLIPGRGQTYTSNIIFSAPRPPLVDKQCTITAMTYQPDCKQLKK